MTRGTMVAAVAATLIAACAVPNQQPSTMPPPPPGGAPPAIPGTPPPDGSDSRIFRFEFGLEPVSTPQGSLSDTHLTSMAYRFAYFGANPTPNFGLGLSARVVDTKTDTSYPALYFFDLIGFYLRYEIPVMPQLKGYLEFEPSMVGMHVRCGDPNDFSCNEDGFEFLPRAGLTGRVGGIYQVVPGRLDLAGYVALQKTIPDEGGWFTVGLAVVAHVGPTHAETRRRRAMMAQPQR